MKTLVQSLAFDVAGLGLLAAGTFALLTGKPTAAAELLPLGGAYLGVKVGASTTT